MDAPVGHPNFGRLFPCECTVKRREERLVSDLWKLSNLDALGDLTFRDFDPNVDGLKEAYEEAREYAKSLQGWIFFHGPCGIGKTHLAVAIAQYAMDNAKLGVYFSVVPDLLDQLRATFDPTTGVAYDERFNQIRNAQLLILDDLGTENTTPWAREKLYQILNHRYNEHRPTVITSNQPFKSIEERILSRLSDTRLTRYIWIDGEDYRRRLRPATGETMRRR
jgi:DNA replication protein DnaC